MEYKFYKADQFPPYWFSFEEMPQEALAFFGIMQRNEIPFIVRGGFALAALLGSSIYQIKDIDLIVERCCLEELIKVDFAGWESFFNKNSRGEDVYSLFYDKGSDTHLKFDVLIMDVFPEKELIFNEMPIVSAEYLLLDKLSKVVEGEARGYEDWKIKKNTRDLKLIVNWLIADGKIADCKESTLSTVRKRMPLLLKQPHEEKWVNRLAWHVEEGNLR